MVKRRLITLLLSFALIFSLIPVQVLAEEPVGAENVCTVSDDCTAEIHKEGCPKAILSSFGGENGSAESSGLTKVQQVQNLINGLPGADSITEDNADTVMDQLDAIDDKKAELSDEEVDELDFARYTAAIRALEALNGGWPERENRRPWQQQLLARSRLRAAQRGLIIVIAQAHGF